MNVPIRPIIQALEFHISAVLVNPRNGGWNLGCCFGSSNWGSKEKYINNLKEKHKILPKRRKDFTYSSRKLCCLNFENKPFAGGSSDAACILITKEEKLLMVNRSYSRRRKERRWKCWWRGHRNVLRLGGSSSTLSRDSTGREKRELNSWMERRIWLAISHTPRVTFTSSNFSFYLFFLLLLFFFFKQKNNIV